VIERASSGDIKPIPWRERTCGFEKYQIICADCIHNRKNRSGEPSPRSIAQFLLSVAGGIAAHHVTVLKEFLMITQSALRTLRNASGNYR